jgi:hypothetical protein
MRNREMISIDEQLPPFPVFTWPQMPLRGKQGRDNLTETISYGVEGQLIPDAGFEMDKHKKGLSCPWACLGQTA